jgi:hypothetical protein
MSPRLTCGVLLLALAGCAGLRDGRYSDGSTKYRIGPIPESWQQLHVTGNDVTYLSRDSGHSLSVNATCEDHDDPPLKVLTQHLLMGFTARETISQTTQRMVDREALRTHVRAALDGVPVELELVVLKKDGCVYDFTYVSPEGQLAAREAVFEQVLANFQTGDAR